MIKNRFSQIAVGAALTAAVTFGSAQTYEDLMNPPAGEWPQVGRDITHQSYSPLTQIDTTNVAQLRMAWARDLGFQPLGLPTNIQGSPSVWNGIMYLATDTGVLALDAATGDQIWQYSRPNDSAVIPDNARRGAPVIFDGKVFVSLVYGLVAAVDAETGAELWSVQLTDKELGEGFSTDPIIADGKLVVGTASADMVGAPGRISAVAVEDGEVLWSFNTVPLSPDEPGYDSWTNPPAWEAGIGGAAPWGVGTYDPETRIVVWGTGQPTPWDRLDHRRGNEGEPTQDLFSASFVALDVDSGELKWYHQVVPGDEWDFDQQTTPVFANLEIDGEVRRTAILATTTGFLVLIDANSGEFIDAHLMHPGPTVHIGYEDDGTPIIDADLRYTESGGQFKMVCPGLRWAQYSAPSYNPETGVYFRPNEWNCANLMVDSIPDDWQPGESALNYSMGPKTNDSYYFDRVGGITAIDPVTGEALWDWGHYYGHTAGVVSTAGGLVFTGAADSTVRALDADSGQVLWEHPVTTGSQAGTISYEVDGQQYIATLVGLTSGGAVDHPDANVPPTVAGNPAVFVFTLPE